MGEQLAPDRVRLGGLTRRERPFGGGRPTVRFAIVVVLTALWVSVLRGRIGTVAVGSA